MLSLVLVLKGKKAHTNMDVNHQNHPVVGLLIYKMLPETCRLLQTELLLPQTKSVHNNMDMAKSENENMSSFFSCESLDFA